MHGARSKQQSPLSLQNELFSLLSSIYIGVVARRAAVKGSFCCTMKRREDCMKIRPSSLLAAAMFVMVVTRDGIS